MAKRKKTGTRKANSIFLRVFLFGFFCTVSVGTYGKVQEYHELQELHAQLESELQEESQKTIEFDNMKEYYTSDSYVEQIAREQLGMVKPNEILYVNRAQ